MAEPDPPAAELVVDVERLARAASSAGCGLWELDVASGAAWVTDETRRLHGLAPDEPATWEGFVRRFHPDDRDEVVAKMKAVIATAGVLDERHRVVLPDGAVRWLRVTARMNGPNRLLGASIDETDRVDAERRAKDHETRILAAAAAAGLGFSEWTTAAGSYLDDRYRELVGVGVDQSDQVRALWLSRIHAEDRPKLEEASRRLRAGEADQITMEYRYDHPQRGEIWLRHSSCRVALARSGEVWLDALPRRDRRAAGPRPRAHRGPERGDPPGRHDHGDRAHVGPLPARRRSNRSCTRPVGGFGGRTAPRRASA